MHFTTEVIVCTYNGSNFIIEQLQSILVQTSKVDKISIYDDQSTDNTVAIIKEFITGLSLENKTIIDLQCNSLNLGYVGNFSKGVAEATEEILFFCDQDDIWETNKVEVLREQFNESQIDMAFSDGILVNEKGSRIDNSTVLKYYNLDELKIDEFNMNPLQFLVTRNVVNGAAAAIRKESAQQALPIPCEIPHDYWFALWAATHNGIFASKQKLYKYRQHGNNVIGIGNSKPKYFITSLWKGCNKIRERELLIWKNITARITAEKQIESTDLVSSKLTWLLKVVPNNKNSLSRLFNIISSLLRGHYKKYSPKYSFIRDVVSLIKVEKSR